FEFLRNEKLDAENYFLNFEQPPGAQRLQKDRLRRNQFGTFLGGPLIRNKTFWSFNYEGRRQTKEGVDTVWWPNADFRRGDFSAAAAKPRRPPRHWQALPRAHYHL